VYAIVIAGWLLLILGTGALTLVRAYWPLTPQPAPGERAAVADLRRAGPAGRRDPSLRWRLAGMLAGGLGAAIAMRTPDLGRGALLAGPFFGLGVFAGALAGELTRRLPAGQVRRAGLRVRRTIDYLPRTLGAIVALSIVALAALATATTITGAPDDAGRAGRALTCATTAYGPWPGSYYTAPTLSVVLAGLLLAAFTLRRVVRRPQPADRAPEDDAARRRSAEVITAATGILVLVPLSGIAVLAGMTLTGFCEAQWFDGAALSVSALGFAAFGAAAWCGACLLLPAKQARA
jgi:hypothetical protein